jgi:CBS domain containing-hemolysin-like protein
MDGCAAMRDRVAVDFWLSLVLALALVLANGFFVAAEFALVRLRPTQVGEFEREGRIAAGSVRDAVDHLDEYLAACQLGITVASIGLGVVGEPAFEHLLAPLLGGDSRVAGIAVAGVAGFALMTLLHVVVGELAPKSVAISRTSLIVVRLAPPLRAFYLVTRPVVGTFNAMGNLLLRPFGIPPASEADHTPYTETELRQLLVQSAADGVIEDIEQQFAERGFRFAERVAADVMQPRRAIRFLDAGVPLDAAARDTVATGRTRLPVCGPGGLDDALGLLHVHDLLAALVAGRTQRAADLVRPIGRADAATPTSGLLERIRLSGVHMMLITDRAGRTVGLVTLTDLLEELVGDLESATDPRPAGSPAAELAVE